MERDRMKIIEFGRDGEGASRRAPSGEVPGGARKRGSAGTRPLRADAGPGAPARMKIIEFDGGGPATAAREVAHVRIIEFDGGAPRTEGVGRPAPGRKRSGPPVRVGPIKIREFGEEGDVRSSSTGGKGRKIRIMEFD